MEPIPLLLLAADTDDTDRLSLIALGGSNGPDATEGTGRLGSKQ